MAEGQAYLVWPLGKVKCFDTLHPFLPGVECVMPSLNRQVADSRSCKTLYRSDGAREVPPNVVYLILKYYLRLAISTDSYVIGFFCGLVPN